MKDETWEAINQRYRRFRSFWAEPVSAQEFDGAFSNLGPLSDGYRLFVLRYGGGYVGTYPIYGLRLAEAMGKLSGATTAPSITDQFRDRKYAGVEDWIVFSVDQSGNPIGLARDGSVWISDADHGQVTMLACSFEAFLRRWALRIDPA